MPPRVSRAAVPLHTLETHGPTFVVVLHSLLHDVDGVPSQQTHLAAVGCTTAVSSSAANVGELLLLPGAASNCYCFGGVYLLVLLLSLLLSSSSVTILLGL